MTLWSIESILEQSACLVSTNSRPPKTALRWKTASQSLAIIWNLCLSVSRSHISRRDLLYTVFLEYLLQSSQFPVPGE